MVVCLLAKSTGILRVLIPSIVLAKMVAHVCNSGVQEEDPNF